MSQPPSHAAPEAPPAVKWFRAYAALMAIIYVAALGLIPLLLWLGEGAPEDEKAGLLITVVIIGIVSIPLLGIYIAAPFFPRRPWVWTFDLVLIAIGMTSCCTMPFAIPLLIFWIKPEAQAWFGKGTAARVSAT